MNRKNRFLIPALLVVFATWGLGLYLSQEYDQTIDALFSAINALFAGLAFVGVIYTLLLQQKTLEQTKVEIDQNQQSLDKQAAILIDTALLNGLNSLKEYYASMIGKDGTSDAIFGPKLAKVFNLLETKVVEVGSQRIKEKLDLSEKSIPNIALHFDRLYNEWSIEWDTMKRAGKGVLATIDLFGRYRSHLAFFVCSITGSHENAFNTFLESLKQAHDSWREQAIARRDGDRLLEEFKELVTTLKNHGK